MKKMIKRNGFTIVELVIVIAVIAILAGVLIPTFGGIIEKANESNDTQLVATINKLLVVENIYTGENPNDVVEIQKMLKANGVKLETKSEGKYLWYDIEKNQVVLAGLDEDGIVLPESENPNQPETIADVEEPTGKGKFKSATSPEDFIDGYLFISTGSKDGLAEAICAIRNPAGVDSAAIKTSLNATLTEIAKLDVPGSGKVSARMSALLGTTAVMTEKGLGYIGDNNSAVIRIIVSSDMTKITKDSLDDLYEGENKVYPNIKYVIFHSGVIDITSSETDNAVELIKGNSSTTFFYSSKEVDNIAKDIDNLAKFDDFPDFFTKIYVADSVDSVVGNKEWISDIDNGADTFTNAGFEYTHKVGTATDSYDFVGYSLYKNGAELLKLYKAGDDVKSYTLTDEQKALIDADGYLTIYRVYKRVNSDFKVTDSSNNVSYYSSNVMTDMLSDGGYETLSTDAKTITVLTTTATLGNETYKNLTIPEGVTLVVPRDVTNTLNTLSDGLHKPTYDTSTNPLYYDDGTKVGLGSKLNKDTFVGERLLTITSGTTLTNYGYITVDAKLYNYKNYQHGFILDEIGVLIVNGTVDNYGIIEAYGIIRSENPNGTINSKNDSKVVEVMSILDLHGGSSTAANVTHNISPFNVFRVDNIRLPMKIEKGAIYTTYGGAFANNTVNTLEFKICDDTSTSYATVNNPLFKLASDDAYVVKSYKAGEGLKITIHGTVEDCKKKVTVMGYDVNFTKLPLPLPSFDITVANGANLTISSATYKVLPGSDIVVEEGGTLNIATKVIVYDSFDLLTEDGETPAVDVRRYANKFEGEEATFTIKGTLNLLNGAQFAGIIYGDSTGTTKAPTIVVDANAKLSPEQISEGYGGMKTYIIPYMVEEYIVNGFEWKGKLPISGSADAQSIEAGATYTCSGNSWTKK